MTGRRNDAQEGKVDSSRSNFSALRDLPVVDDEASHYPATLQLSRIFRFYGTEVYLFSRTGLVVTHRRNTFVVVGLLKLCRDPLNSITRYLSSLPFLLPSPQTRATFISSPPSLPPSSLVLETETRGRSWIIPKMLIASRGKFVRWKLRVKYRRVVDSVDCSKLIPFDL